MATACLVRLSIPQEVVWAAKRILSESQLEPVENACVECHDSVVDGWAMSFTEAMAKARESECFRKEVLLANEVRLHNAKPSWAVQDVYTVVRQGRRVSQGGLACVHLSVSLWRLVRHPFSVPFGVSVCF